MGVIDQLLREYRCDLVVAGSGVPLGWRRLRFGSVASDLAYRCNCHALIIPEGAGWVHRQESLAAARYRDRSRRRPGVGLLAAQLSDRIG